LKNTGDVTLLRQQNKPDQFVMAQYSQALLAAYMEQGGELEQLASSLGVSTGELCQPTGKISVDHYLALIRQAKAISGDAFLGLHIGKHQQAATFSVLGKAMLKANTLGVALQQVLPLEGLVHTLGHSEVLREPGAVRFVWHCHYQLHPQARDVVESVLAGIIHFAKQLAGRPIPVLASTFVHEQPKVASLTAYRQICHSSCHFSQSQNSILVADEVLAWPNKMGQQHAPHEPETSPANTTLSQKVTHFLEERLAQGNPPLKEVAAQYHLTLRTFQRRLDREGTQYIQILNEVRRRLAKDYLLYSTMNTLQISQMLGFKEQSSFNHFFSDNLNMTPTEFRRCGKEKS